jgi:hypothetical protein
MGEIPGSHGDECEDDCLLGCCDVYSGRKTDVSEVFTSSIRV